MTTTNNLKPLNRNIVLNALRRAVDEVKRLAKAPCPDKAAYAYRCAYAAGVVSLASRFTERRAEDPVVDALVADLFATANALRTQTRFATRKG